MFSVTIPVVLTVIFVSAQGQTTSSITTTTATTTTATTTTATTTTATTTTSATTTSATTTTATTTTATTTTTVKTSSSSATSSGSVSLLSTPTTTESSTKTSVSTEKTEVPTTPSALMTCVKLGATLELAWHDDYEKKSSEQYQNISGAFVSALNISYNDSAKYKDVDVSNVNMKKKDGKVSVEGILCLHFVGGDEDVIVVVFRKKVETGKLSDNLPVLKDSAEVEPQGVSFKSWEAKEGECDKCEGDEAAGGPFKIERECEQKTYSCKGQETTKETKECTKYCSSTVAVTVSFVILAIGIFLSSSFQ